MSEISIRMASPEGVVLTVLTHLRNGQIDDAIARFAEEFRFKDHGIGLEFKDKERLTEFFQKTRELYPDSLLQTDTIFVSGDHMITEWTLQATLTEPFLRRTLTKGSSLAARDLHRSDRQRQDYRLGRLLRRTDLQADSLGFVFHGMGRTLNGGESRMRTLLRLSTSMAFALTMVAVCFGQYYTQIVLDVVVR